MYGIKNVGEDLQIVEGVPELDTMQSVVEGYITTAFRYPSPTRSGIELDVYCNDEGLLIDLPLNFFRPTDGSPIVGNVIVTASDWMGETVAATREEIEAMLDYILA